MKGKSQPKPHWKHGDVYGPFRMNSDGVRFLLRDRNGHYSFPDSRNCFSKSTKGSLDPILGEVHRKEKISEEEKESEDDELEKTTGAGGGEG